MEDPIVPHHGLSQPLNPEPADAETRQAYGLSPKSYENAAKEALQNGSAETHNDIHVNGNAHKAPQEEEQPGDTLNKVTPALANLYSDSVLEKEMDGLTSIKEPNGYYIALQQDEKERPSPNQNEPHKDELIHGRKAGQPWHESP